MAYGDTLSYTYEAEVENENGELETKKETLYFTYNANTALIYRRLFDADFLHEVTKITAKSAKNIPQSILDKVNSGELSIKDIDSIDTDSIKLGDGDIGIDTYIITKIAIALVATNDSVNRRPHRTVEEIANDLPDISTNMELMLALLEFVMLGLKKKKITSRRF